MLAKTGNFLCHRPFLASHKLPKKEFCIATVTKPPEVSSHTEENQFPFNHTTLDQRSRNVMWFHRNHSCSLCEPLLATSNILKCEMSQSFPGLTFSLTWTFSVAWHFQSHWSQMESCCHLLVSMVLHLHAALFVPTASVATTQTVNNKTTH